MSRWIGIDLGERRIGLAVADDVGSHARPMATIPRGRTLEADLAAIGQVVRSEGIGVLVVGLPLEASGASGPQAELTRAWAESVASGLGLPLVLRDERLTSHLAEERLGPMKRGRSGGPPSRTQRNAYRARVDREAAAIILQDELDARTRVPYEGPGTDDPTETSA